MNLTHEDLNRLRSAAGASPAVQRALNPALWHLLPNGPLYLALRLADESRSQAMLSRLERAATDASTDPASMGTFASDLMLYLRAIEKDVHDIDLGNPNHQKLLMTLRMLLPPESISRPCVFVVAGPSGAGKDTVLRNVVEALHVRGFPASFLTKPGLFTPNGLEES